MTLIDNGNAGYSEAGTGWTTLTQKGALNGSQRWHASGKGANTASWQFNGLSPGWYKVEATWASAGNQATNTPYTVYDGLTSRGSVTVNQKKAPAGDTFQGNNWTILGTFPIGGSTLLVQISDKANNRVVADGVRIVPVQNTVQILSLNRSLTSVAETAQVSVTVQVP